jgi:DTW domain-containing protein YfiP
MRGSGAATVWSVATRGSGWHVGVFPRVARYTLALAGKAALPLRSCDTSGLHKPPSDVRPRPRGAMEPQIPIEGEAGGADGGEPCAAPAPTAGSQSPVSPQPNGKGRRQLRGERVTSAAYHTQNGAADAGAAPLALRVQGWSVDADRPYADLKQSFEAMGKVACKRFNPQLQRMLEGVYTARGGFKRNAETIKCPKCWMVPAHCFCDDHPTEARHATAGIDVVCYLHWREASVRKASNTAKLVPMLLQGGRLVACGDVAAEAALYTDLCDESGAAAILFPSDDAISIEEWCRRRAATAAAAAAADADAPAQPRPPPTLVVLDGTWKEARLLNKFLPAHATRVSLNSVPEDLAQLRTRWAHPDRTNIQSMAAVIAALSEAGLAVDVRTTLKEHLEAAINKYVDQTFPEKAQKPHYTREDKVGRPDLLRAAAAGAVDAGIEPVHATDAATSGSPPPSTSDGAD